MPLVEWIVVLLRKATQNIPAGTPVGINLDCGLKTRVWPETRQLLANMVLVAQHLRKQ